MMRRIANAILGFVAGIVSIPLVALIWPMFAAWYMFNETDGDGK